MNAYICNMFRLDCYHVIQDCIASVIPFLRGGSVTNEGPKKMWRAI